jgi:hypothetical protein
MVLVVNAILNWIPSWIIIPLSAIILAQTLHFRNFEIRYGDKPKSWHDKEEWRNKTEAMYKQRLITVGIIIAVAAIWGYSDSQKVADQELALQLEAASWAGRLASCENSDVELDSYGNEIYIRGWPCIIVGSVNEVKFIDIDGKPYACVNVNFDNEIGLPGEDIFEKAIDTKRICAETNLKNAASDLEDKIQDRMNKLLVDLASDLCLTYYYQLSDIDRTTYCS